MVPNGARETGLIRDAALGHGEAIRLASRYEVHAPHASGRERVRAASLQGLTCIRPQPARFPVHPHRKDSSSESVPATTGRSCSSPSRKTGTGPHRPPPMTIFSSPPAGCVPGGDPSQNRTMDTLITLAGIGSPIVVAITVAFAITSRMLRSLR
jgi:hypothetical protein